MNITLRYGIAVAASVVIGSAIFLPDATPRKQVKTADIAYLWEAVAERMLVLPDRFSVAYTNTLGTRTNIASYQMSGVTTNTIVYSNIIWKTDTSVTNRYWKSVATPNIANTNEGTFEAYSTFDHWAVDSNVFVSTGQYFFAWVPGLTPSVRLFDPVYSNFHVVTSYGELSGTYTWDTNSTQTRLKWRNGGRTLTRILEDYGYTWNEDWWIVRPYPTDITHTWLLEDGNGNYLGKSATGLDGGALKGPCRWISSGYEEVDVDISGSGGILASAPHMTYAGYTLTNVPNLITRINSGGSGDAAMSLYSIDMAIGRLIPSYIDTSVRGASNDYNGYFSTIRYSNTVTTISNLTINKAFQLAGVGTTYVHTIYGHLVTNRWFSWPPAETNLLYSGMPSLYVYGGLSPRSYYGGITTNALYERYRVLQLLTETQESMQSSNAMVVYTDKTKYLHSDMSSFAGYGHMFSEYESVLSSASFWPWMMCPPDEDLDFTADYITGDDLNETHDSTINDDEYITRYRATELRYYTNVISDIHAAAYSVELDIYSMALAMDKVTPDNSPPYYSASGGGINCYSRQVLYDASSPKVWRAGIPAATGIEADFDFYTRHGTANIRHNQSISMLSTSPCSLAYSTTDFAEHDLVYTPTNTPLEYPPLAIHLTYATSTTEYQDGALVHVAKSWTGNPTTQANYSISTLKGPVVSRWKFRYCAP